jgi:hypothetical protein
MIYVPCPSDSRIRFAFWFTPDPAPGKPKEELNLAGTPADPKVLADFLGHFELCPS